MIFQEVDDSSAVLIVLRMLADISSRARLFKRAGRETLVQNVGRINAPPKRRYQFWPDERGSQTVYVNSWGRMDSWKRQVSEQPMSSAAKVTERLRRPNYGTLELEITVDDPTTYTRPWTVSTTQKIEIDTELIDEFCLENEKS